MSKKAKNRAIITAKVFLNFNRFFKKETKGLNNNENTIAIIQ